MAWFLGGIFFLFVLKRKKKGYRLHDTIEYGRRIENKVISDFFLNAVLCFKEDEMSFTGAENETQILNIGLQKDYHWLTLKVVTFNFLSFADHQHVSHGHAECVFYWPPDWLFFLLSLTVLSQ